MKLIKESSCNFQVSCCIKETLAPTPRYRCVLVHGHLGNRLSCELKTAQQHASLIEPPADMNTVMRIILFEKNPRLVLGAHQLAQLQ